MSKKHHKNKSLIIWIISLIWLIAIGFMVIYNQNNKILDQYSDNPNIPKMHDKQLSELIEIQQKKWIREILNIDCDILTNKEAMDYCISQKKLVNTIIGK
jgi:hypothetical protein